MRRKTPKGLSDEDRELWQRVAKTAVPLRPEGRKLDSIPAENRKTPKKPNPQTRTSLDRFEVGQKAKSRPNGHDLLPHIEDRVARAPVQMDRKNYERLRKGKLVPEGRIDLHGLTLAQAHPALTRFVMTAHAEGKRLVLVITGKGKSRDEGGPIPVRYGVLKHQVPQWLAMPPLGAVVLQITQAHLKHGGTGAYYVYLRRQR